MIRNCVQARSHLETVLAVMDKCRNPASYRHHVILAMVEIEQIQAEAAALIGQESGEARGCFGATSPSAADMALPIGSSCGSIANYQIGEILAQRGNHHNTDSGNQHHQEKQKSLLRAVMQLFMRN